MRPTHRFVILLALLIMHEPPAFGVCPQPHPRVCAEFFKSDAVLSGTVVAEIAQRGDDGFISGWTYRVAVDRVFRGPRARTIELFTENDSGRLRLKPRRQYLMFAAQRDGKWMIGGCGNSRPLKDAAGLIRQIERVGKESTGDIYGHIASRPSWTGVSGVEVVARGAMGNYRAVSDSTGSFRMTVRPGRYTVAAQSEGVSAYDLSYDDPSDFQVPRGGCSQLQFIAPGG